MTAWLRLGRINEAAGFSATITPPGLRSALEPVAVRVPVAPEAMDWVAISTEAFDFAREARRCAYPSGARRVDLPGLGCVEFAENAEGERVKCEGTMFMVVQPEGAMPDMICTFDRHHRIEPEVYRRPHWRTGAYAWWGRRCP